MGVEGRFERTSWSSATAEIYAELRALRRTFGAEWAVVWGPMPVRANASFASVLFEDKAEGCASALGIAVPIVGNPWAASLFTEGGAIALDARTDPRLRLHERLITRNRIVSLASGAALNDGVVHAVVELYAQRPLARSASLVADLQGAARRIAALFEGRPAEEVTHGAKAAPGDALTIAALHDLKSALAAQSLLIASFEKDLRAVASGILPEPSRVASMMDSLTVMRESVTHASELARVMTLGSLTPGSRVPIDLPAIARLSLASIPLDLRDRFDVISDAGLAVARPVTDAPSLLRAMVHLVQNAALAIQRVKGARATIRVRSEDDTAVVDVEDEGQGVAPEVMSRLFQPGVTTRERPDGHGFGLSSARLAVESLGGTLTLYNIPRHGARFTMRVPREVAGM